VFKREAKSIDEVSKKLQRDGWEKTGSLANGRVLYFQKSGIEITAAKGPMGTLIFPSGPIRGKLFGSGVGINTTSVLGMGAATDSQSNPKRSTVSNGSRTLN